MQSFLVYYVPAARGKVCFLIVPGLGQFHYPSECRCSSQRPRRQLRLRARPRKRSEKQPRGGRIRRLTGLRDALWKRVRPPERVGVRSPTVAVNPYGLIPGRTVDSGRFYGEASARPTPSRRSASRSSIPASSTGARRVFDVHFRSAGDRAESPTPRRPILIAELAQKYYDLHTSSSNMCPETDRQSAGLLG